MALLRGTRPAGETLTLTSVLLAAILGAAACSGSPTSSVHSPTPAAASSPSAPSSTSPSASSSPSASPPASASPSPTVTGSYGVLAGPFSGTNYSVALVDVTGQVVASAQASNPASPTCANTAAGVVPAAPVSTSNSRAYYMDAGGAVRWIAPDGSHSSGVVTTLSVGPSTRSIFSISPDDSEIAVAVIDFTQGGATTRLFVDDLKIGGAQHLIFSETGSYTAWPIGWHAGSLVVAKVVACTQGGGPFCCGPLELHVVNPLTAAREYTLGGPGCVIAGPASPGGVVCESSTFTQAQEINWAGGAFNTFSINGPEEAFISPDSNLVAVVSTGSNVTNVRVAVSLNGIEACEWVDNTHLLAGGVAQSQPRVADLTKNKIAPVAAQGDCAGRIPGAL